MSKQNTLFCSVNVLTLIPTLDNPLVMQLQMSWGTVERMWAHIILGESNQSLALISSRWIRQKQNNCELLMIGSCIPCTLFAFPFKDEKRAPKSLMMTHKNTKNNQSIVAISPKRSKYQNLTLPTQNIIYFRINEDTFWNNLVC